MGDNGALYVKPELVPVYREKVGLPNDPMHFSMFRPGK